MEGERQGGGIEVYCGQCGKKIMENMLFCPFCGAPVVIPEQGDARPDEAPEAIERAPEAAWAARGADAPEDAQSAPEAGEREAASPARAADSSDSPAEPAAQAQDAAPSQTAREAAAPSPLPARDGAKRERASSPREADRPVSLFAEFDDATEEFVPLNFDAEDPVQVKPAPLEIVPAEPEPEEAPPEPARRPVRRTAPQEFRRPEGARRRAAQTYIPVKEVDPADMFMDDDDEYDDFEAGRGDYAPRRHASPYEFEEPEYGGFLQRHVRGVVGLSLIVVLVAVLLIWAFSSGGQLALARANLAWEAQPYADLGYEAYRQGSYLQAARYYEKAYDREDTNYEYAHSAMVAYYDSGDAESAATMLKACISMQPNSVEPYQELLILYPDAQSRPWEIQELIRQGYERTGDASLNPNPGA